MFVSKSAKARAFPLLRSEQGFSHFLPHLFQKRGTQRLRHQKAKDTSHHRKKKINIEAR